MNFKEKLLELMQEKPEKHYSVNKFQKELNAMNSSAEKEIQNALDELTENGDIIKLKANKYELLEVSGLQRGTLSGNARGFAFFRPDNPENPDMFIPNRNLSGAYHNDRVLARVIPDPESDDVGFVEKILQRGNETVVGEYIDNKKHGFVMPDDKRFFDDIYIPNKRKGKAHSGDKVFVQITKWKNKNGKNPEGKIVEILGKPGEVGVDVLSLIRAHNIRDDFPKEVLDEARAIPQEVQEEAKNEREDFRNKQVITIDGDDSRDFDDAISIDKNSDGTFNLGVHIADVTEYVKENSPLDKEAFERATSIYFVDRVIPMLPKELSNGICSLNEGVDRLTLSCIMKVSKTGKLLESRVSKTIIRSTHRMTYNNVNKIIEGDNDLREKYKDILPMIDAMLELAKVMIKRRDDEGAVDFDTPEAKIILDEQGKVVDIKRYERKISNQIIEEFMILANRAVAEQMYYLDLPFVYRVHEDPDEEKIDNFAKLMVALGVHFQIPSTGIHSKNFQILLKELEGSKLFDIVNKVMLRSMKKARYSPNCTGHFGLSAKYYCHFTSPIRRYPDLFVHRMLKKLIDGEFNNRVIKEDREKSLEISTHSSQNEVKAAEAERDSDDLKKSEYMKEKLGEVFTGKVSGVTSFGVFVELENTCEGLVRTATLPDGDYEYIEELYEMRGTNHSYRLGDEVTIQVASVSLETRKVEFVMFEE